MDPLDNITKNTLDIAEAARGAYKIGDIRNSKILIETIRDYLLETWSADKAIDKQDDNEKNPARTEEKKDVSKSFHNSVK